MPHCSVTKVQKPEGFTPVIISAAFTLPLLLQMGITFLPLGIEFLLATIVQFGFGWRFYRSSYRAIKQFSGNMDLLICLGTSAAYGFSTVVFLLHLPEPVYFESSATIITLVLLGRALETRAQRKASHAIEALLKKQPKTIRLWKKEKWEETPIENIQKGDVFQVLPGERVPIDGFILEGESSVEESMLTGESLPAAKHPQDKVFAGTQNLEGSFIGKATALGSQTALSHIIQLVKEAQSSRAPIQRHADRLCAVFIPAVLAVSAITLGVWWGLSGSFTLALIPSVATLVIACPCALGMATPLVVVIAIGKGAQTGIFIKNAEALQNAEKLSTLAIDKTGTLTEGRPSLADIIPAEGYNVETIKKYAASLAFYSEHPLAKAFLKAHPEGLEKVLDFKTIPGKGVEGRIGNKKYFLGSLLWAQEKNIPLSPSMISTYEKQGKTLCFLSADNLFCGYLAVKDPLRETSLQGIIQMKERGLKTVMLTGDRTPTAQAIAQEAGIEEVRAEILPVEKAQAIQELRKTRGVIGMVGDGINDAPALAAADVGFSMKSGSDVALEASDITLMKNNLIHVVDAIDLSQRAFQKIHQNLFFAFIYNGLAIPLAAVGWLNPMIAAAAMALSSLSVVINSLILNHWSPPSHHPR